MQVQKVTFISILLTFLSGQVFAQAPQPVQRIGYVNFEQAFAGELEAKKALEELQSKENNLGEEFRLAQANFQNKIAQFQQTMKTLKEDEQKKRQAALEQEAAILQQSFSQKQMELNNERQETVNKLESKNRLLLESIAREKNYDMILNSGAIFYMTDAIKKQNDLTALLVEKYNKTYQVAATGTGAAAKKAGK